MTRFQTGRFLRVCSIWITDAGILTPASGFPGINWTYCRYPASGMTCITPGKRSPWG